MNSDFKDLLSELEKYQVEYLVVGGYAVMFYAEPRYTNDIDIFLSERAENVDRFGKALAEFGYSLTVEQLAELKKENRMIILGSPPNRIDILNQIKGVSFEEAWQSQEVLDLDGIKARFIGLEQLILAKQASGREIDKFDLVKLKKALQKRSKQ